MAATPFIGGCGVDEAQAAADAGEVAGAPLPVEIVAPMRTEISATYHTTTTIESDAEAPIIARVAGEVVEILVEEGDVVEQGQVLARLDGDRLRLEMQHAKANLEMASREYDRMIGLHERGLVSADAFDGMKYDLDAMRANYELRRLEYEYTRIRAPITGVVSARDIKVGQNLVVNDTAFRVTDTTALVAHLRIPQSELGKISVGQEAVIHVDSMPESAFVATIDRISPTIDARNGTFRATAYVDNSSALLAPGMFGRFDIAYEKHTDALTIPSAAIVDEDGELVVYIVTDDKAIRRVIETGIQQDGVTEVIRGIDDADRIVVTGQGSLRDGSPVLASLPAGTTATG